MTADACGQLGCELDASSSSSSQSATDSNSSSGGDTVEQASAENDQQDGDVSRFDEIDTNGFVLFADDRVYILQSTETPDQAADRLAAAAAAVQSVNTEGVTAAQERGQRVPLVLICSHKLANLKTFVFGFMFLYFRLEFANDASTSSTDVQRHVLITRNKALTYKIINYLSNTDAVLEITNADSTIVSNINTDVFNNKTTMNVKLYQPVLELMVPKLDLFAASTSHDSQRGRFDSNNVRPTVSVTETKREYVLLRRSIIITEEQIFICAESFAQLSAPVKPKTKSLASKLFGMNSDTDTKVKPRFRVLQTLQREHFSHAKTKESTKQYFTFELVFGTKNAFTRELSNKSTLVLRVPDRATFKKIQNCMF
jgi:hypothetical protein